MGAALRSRDVVTARREADHAAAAWPTQPAYLWGQAVTAAMASDTGAVRAALANYARLGLGRDLRGDTSIAKFLGLRGFDIIVRQHTANRAPLARSRVVASLPDSTFWPEGMDADVRTGAFYVASVRHGTIAELAPAKPPRELWPRHQKGIGAVLGVRVDPARGVLWATLSGIPQMERYVPADSAIAALVRVRIADGIIERRWDLPPVAGGHVLGDLAIGPAGDVFMTDSSEPVLYRLRPGTDSLERLTSRLFRSLQGMAPAPDGRRLYVADYSHGLLLVDLSTTAVRRLADAPHSTSLGCDGIAWHRGAIVAVQNGVAPARVMRYVLDAAGQRIVRADLLDRNLARADEPTIGAVVGGQFVYVANSQWEKYADDGTRRPAIPLTAPLLLAVPLP
jgi:sugar lactone lactonase YvrE